jgi:ATP-dependent Clp protease ATP-binding subunit ClpX
LKFELPSTDVKGFAVDQELVDDPEQALTTLLAEHKQHETVIMRDFVGEFAQRFLDAHGLTIQFTDQAADKLVVEAVDRSIQVRDLCANKFKDFQFGLRLISQNTGRQEFTIDEAMIEDPDKTLSDWVVASYKESSNESPDAEASKTD